MMQSGGRSGRLLLFILGCVVGLLTLLGGPYAVISSDKVRSAWSAGVKWGDGSPAGDRTDAYWLPDSRQPTSGKPFPDVAIAGALQTDYLRAASWTLGISDFLADLSPNTATLTFVGQVSGVPGDDVVISTGLGVAWAGRLDTVTQTRDVAGDWWTTITATDRIGALGAAQLTAYSVSVTVDADLLMEQVAESVGITIDVVDQTVSGIDNPSGTPASFDGSPLDYINQLAQVMNLMLATTSDGRIAAVRRESVTPSSVLTLSGVNAPQSWSLSTSIDVDINTWVGGSSVTADDEADVAQYGARTYLINPDSNWAAIKVAFFTDWWAYGGSQRPTASGTLIVSDYSQDKLILLDPFQWVTEDGTDWQVMSVQHDVTASPYSWNVSITADNLLSLL